MTGPSSPHCISIGKPGSLHAKVNLHGAELWRLVDGDGTDLQWSGDPAVWSGRAPILFPIIGELAGGAYRYQGRSYPLARHGFARRRQFSVIEQSSDAVLLRLAADDETREVYPFEFQLDLRFSCASSALTVAVEVSNRGEQPMPFSFGFHPALRWPLEPAATRADHAIIFADPEPAPISRLDAKGLVMAERQPSPVVAQRLILDDDLFIGDALIFSELASRSVRYGGFAGAAPQGRQMRVDFTGLPLLGVWTKPGAHYICIEPWHGIADPEGFDGDIFAKPGIVALAAGAVWQARMVLTAEAAR